jgi:hypothetical protein
MKNQQDFSGVSELAHWHPFCLIKDVRDFARCSQNPEASPCHRNPPFSCRNGPTRTFRAWNRRRECPNRGSPGALISSAYQSSVTSVARIHAISDRPDACARPRPGHGLRWRPPSPCGPSPARRRPARAPPQRLCEAPCREPKGHGKDRAVPWLTRSYRGI